MVVAYFKVISPNIPGINTTKHCSQRGRCSIGNSNCARCEGRHICCCPVLIVPVPLWPVQVWCCLYPGNQSSFDNAYTPVISPVLMVAVPLWPVLCWLCLYPCKQSSFDYACTPVTSPVLIMPVPLQRVQFWLCLYPCDQSCFGDAYTPVINTVLMKPVPLWSVLFWWCLYPYDQFWWCLYPRSPSAIMISHILYYVLTACFPYCTGAV